MKVLLAVLLAGTAIAAQAQSPDAAAAALGQALLAQGDLARAQAQATAVLTQYPFSTDGLRLAVDVERARAGGLASLTVYDRWAALNKKEDAPALHAAVRAVLRDIVRRPPDRGTRIDAMDALVNDGDPELLAALAQTPAPDDTAESGVRAGAGDAQALAELIAEASVPSPNKRLIIQGLARSKSPQAVRPLVAMLTDANPATRMQAAGALGQLEARSAIPDLKALLNDRLPTVQYAAATALFALKDPSGRTWLRTLSTSEAPAGKLNYVLATRSEPDAFWLGTVRELTRDRDPEIRRQAAELLAPHDPDAAGAVLKPLLADANPSEVEAATDTLVRITTDLAMLRKALRGADPRSVVHAAARILEITR